MKGAYILEIQVQKEIKISVGSLDRVNFKRGFYYYFGSAMGSQGSTTLLNRVKRHLKNPHEKKKFWHIDYLLENNNALITKIVLIPSRMKLECELIDFFSRFTSRLISKFGCSDCKCKSHLLYFERPLLLDKHITLNVKTAK